MFFTFCTNKKEISFLVSIFFKPEIKQNEARGLRCYGKPSTRHGNTWFQQYFRAVFFSFLWTKLRISFTCRWTGYILIITNAFRTSKTKIKHYKDCRGVLLCGGERSKTESGRWILYAYVFDCFFTTHRYIIHVLGRQDQPTGVYGNYYCY